VRRGRALLRKLSIKSRSLRLRPPTMGSLCTRKRLWHGIDLCSPFADRIRK
jgi:hypothetical protein